MIQTFVEKNRKLLALVGIAEILRRLLPMFDESRTLV